MGLARYAFPGAAIFHSDRKAGEICPGDSEAAAVLGSILALLEAGSHP